MTEPKDPWALPALRLTHGGALRMLEAALACADRLGEPQCVTICDAGGTVIVQCRMTGARLNALAISAVKARSSASTRAPTGPEDAAVALACGGAQTGLEGGLPIFLDGQHVGGIGVSSGPAEADLACARAALAAHPRLSEAAP
jgi:uncharacterized protein GlcG (DUF336 family)